MIYSVSFDHLSQSVSEPFLGIMTFIEPHISNLCNNLRILAEFKPNESEIHLNQIF